MGPLLTLALALVAHAVSASASAASASAATDYDVIVYGATPGGIMSALAAANEGANTLLLHPLAHVGGMVTGGLGQTDIGTSAVIGGAAHDFFVRVGQKYGSKTGAPQYTFEPHVAEAVFLDLIGNASSTGLLTLKTLETLSTAAVAQGVVTSITTVPTAAALAADPSVPTASLAALLLGGAAAATTYTAKLFLDGSYEGDLLAAAGISTTYGREAAAQYNESLNGRLFVPNHVGGHQFNVPVNYTWPNGTILPMIYTGDPGVVGQADQKLEAFNFRMCLTSNVSNQVPIGKPATYDPAYWELLRRYLAIVNFTSVTQLMNIGNMPNHKTDVNNNGAISTDFIGGGWEWPNASPAQRQAIWQQHKDYTQGFFYFLANDESVNPSLRKEMQSWGLSADEFADNENWPYQLYVREARRMVSDFVFTQSDREFNLTKPDSIGLFSYNIDTHNAQRIPQGTYVRNEGDVEMYGGLGPGQIPYRVLVPKRGEATNLLAPVPCSASHIGFGTIRLEPQWMIVGQSAGVAAAQALSAGVAVQDLDVAKLQARLTALGQILSWK